MKRKINNDQKIKNLKMIRNIYYSVSIVLFLFALLERINVININFNLIPVLIVLLIIVIIIISVMHLINNPNKVDTLLIEIIGIILVFSFAILGDLRKNDIKFANNSDKTEATIYNVMKYFEYHRGGCKPGQIRCSSGCCYADGKRAGSEDEPYYTVSYKYEISFIIDEKTYNSNLWEYDRKKYSSEKYAEKSKSKYSKYNNLTIFYDKDNPTNVREYITTNYGTEYYVILVIVILFQFVYYVLFNNFVKKYINN